MEQANTGFLISRRLLMGRMLVIVLLLYGGFSSPFPDEYGISELLIGLLLISIGIFQLPSLAGIIFNVNYFSCSIPFVWMLVVPTLVGIFHWDVDDIIRDIVPLFYLFLPLILFSWAEKISGIGFVRSYLVSAMVVGGGGFALRYFTSQGIGFGDLGTGLFLINLKYYSYDPLVTFAAIYGLLFALTLLKSSSMTKYPLVVTLAGISLLAVGSLGGIGQRAPLAILCVCLIIFIFKYAGRSSIPAWFSIFLLLAIIFYFRDIVFAFYSLLAEKTEIVGINGKFEEFELIIDILSDSWYGLLFGLGWGGVYYNPIIDGTVRFSHSIVGFYLLKTGLVGLVIMSSYVYWLAKLYINVLLDAWRSDVTQLPLLFAIGSAPIIALLQPTYKTLGFGLLLTLIPVLYFEMQGKSNMYVKDRLSNDF